MRNVYTVHPVLASLSQPTRWPLCTTSVILQVPVPMPIPKCNSLLEDVHSPPVTCSPSLSRLKREEISSGSSQAPNKHGKAPGTDASPHRTVTHHNAGVTASLLFSSKNPLAKCPSVHDQRHPFEMGRISVNAGVNRGTRCG